MSLKKKKKKPFQNLYDQLNVIVIIIVTNLSRLVLCLALYFFICDYFWFSIIGTSASNLIFRDKCVRAKLTFLNVAGEQKT